MTQHFSPGFQEIEIGVSFKVNNAVSGLGEEKLKRRDTFQRLAHLIAVAFGGKRMWLPIKGNDLPRARRVDEDLRMSGDDQLAFSGMTKGSQDIVKLFLE